MELCTKAGCRRSRFCRGIQRPASLLSNCPLNGEAYGLTAVKAGHAGADLGYPCLLYFGFERAMTRFSAALASRMLGFCSIWTLAPGICAS